MNDEEIKFESANNTTLCATHYEAVDVSANDYVPETRFKGLIAPEDGEIEIVGVDGVAVVISVFAGIQPLGGRAILAAGTTVTSLTALR